MIKVQLSLWLMIGLGLVAGLIPLPAMAQEPVPLPPLTGPWRNYTDSNAIQDLALEGNWVWAATTGGLVRWNRIDGSYLKYTMADGLPTNNIRDLAIDPAGQKWLATSAGVVSFDGQNWVTYTVADGLAADRIYAIAADPNGRIWAGTDLGLSVFMDQRWASVQMPAEWGTTPFITALALEPAGGIWIGSQGKGLSRLSLAQEVIPYSEVEGHLVAKFEESAWTTYSEADGLITNRVTEIVVDPAGAIWVGTPLGLSRLNEQGWTTFTQADGLPSHIIKALAVDPAGWVWVATDSYLGGGVSGFDGQQWHPLLSQDRFMNDQAVLALASDETTSLWLGTAGAGLWQRPLPASTLTPPPEPVAIPERLYQTQDGPADNRLWTVAVDPVGQLWFGTYENGITIFNFNDQSWRTLTTAEGLVDDDVNTILMGADGAAWLGTGGGISRLTKQGWTRHTYGSGLASNGITGLALDRAGRLWAATTSEGGSALDEQGWTTYTTDAGLADNFVQTVAIDGQGRPWFGTNSGVSMFDGQAWRTYTTTDGLADNIVWAMAVGPANQLWLATSKGLNQLIMPETGNTAPQWRTHLAGLSLNTVAIDPAGQVWAAGSSQVYRYDGQMWHSYTLPPLHESRIEGLAFDRAGQVWVATFGEGVIVFDPATWLSGSP